MSIRAYCAKHRVKEPAFYWWRAELARRDVAKPKAGASAERHGIDPQAYLRGVSARIPAMPMSQLEKLLPERWRAADESVAPESPSQTSVR